MKPAQTDLLGARFEALSRPQMSTRGQLILIAVIAALALGVGVLTVRALMIGEETRQAERV
ncbi:hypothetical protein [Hoeflea sp.]|uniref:hypothetical protein n=1 Tax=Hoeflea sp. TaxID=1940281 RepID=UPI003BB12B4B